MLKGLKNTRTKQHKTLNKPPRRIHHKATKIKTFTEATVLERSVPPEGVGVVKQFYTFQRYPTNEKRSTNNAKTNATYETTDVQKTAPEDPPWNG